MTSERKDTWTLTPFERWVQDEGLKIITQHTVPSVFTEELAPWERTGCDAALLDLTHHPSEERLVQNQGGIRYLIEIPPGGTLNLERHMYEEIFYVLTGRGATTLWYDGTPRQTFEWHADSAFAIPLNAWHELHNGSGTDPVRLYAATNMPHVFNLFASADFVFNTPKAFTDRFDPSDEMYFSGQTVRVADRLMAANFIPSITHMSLDQWSYRGPGSNMYVIMAGGRYVCHVSEFPTASYKKGHGFGMAYEDPSRGQTTDVSYLFLTGEGYDLQWPPGVMPGPDAEWSRIEFKPGSLMSNGHGGHQHFNVSDEPARYLVLREGNPGFTGSGRRAGAGQGQIEFEDEDPRIRELFEQECTAWRAKTTSQ